MKFIRDWWIRRLTPPAKPDQKLRERRISILRQEIAQLEASTIRSTNPDKISSMSTQIRSKKRLIEALEK